MVSTCQHWRPTSRYYEVYYSREALTIWLIEEGEKFLKHFHTITNFPTDTAVAHCASVGHLISLAVSSRRLAQPGDRAVVFNELDPFFVHVNLERDTIREHNAVVCAT
jgi:hypothetical protein